MIASLTLSNVLFVHSSQSGAIVIDRWIQPPSSAGAKVDQQMYMILWGARQLLVTKGLPSRIYRFYTKDLPTDLMMALDGASPLSDEEARGFIFDEKEDEKKDEKEDEEDEKEEAPVVIDLPEPEGGVPEGVAPTVVPAVVNLASGEKEAVVVPTVVNVATEAKEEESKQPVQSVVNVATEASKVATEAAKVAGSAILQASDQAAEAAQTFVDSLLPKGEAEPTVK